MRPYVVLMSLITIILLGLPSLSHGNSLSIQEQIDAAKPGETILLSKAEYVEHLVIHKPLQIIGEEGVTLTHQGGEPAIHIQSNDVTIENVNIHYVNTGTKEAAILMEGNDNVIQQVDIRTNSFGIQLNEAHRNTIAHSHIVGDPNIRLVERQHGIDLWKSNGNDIYNNDLEHVNDGIYIERSEHNDVKENRVSKSRYGYHLMFTKQTELTHNHSSENISGMMVMGTEGTLVKDNQLVNNRRNVQSLGLLLFDVKDALVIENEILNNRVGVLIENAQENELTDNLIQGNYIGIRFKLAKDNVIYDNAFIANLVQGQAEQSDGNDLNGNYWADHAGIDVTGDEKSDLAYYVDPFFLTITDEYPPFQLMFQAPGMIFLEQLIDIPKQEQLIDHTPLMSSPLISIDDESASQIAVILLSLAFICLSIMMIYMGVKVK